MFLSRATVDLDLTTGVLDLRVEVYLRQHGLSSPLKDEESSAQNDS